MRKIAHRLSVYAPSSRSKAGFLICNRKHIHYGNHVQIFSRCVTAAHVATYSRKTGTPRIQIERVCRSTSLYATDERQSARQEMRRTKPSSYVLPMGTQSRLRSGCKIKPFVSQYHNVFTNLNRSCAISEGYVLEF